MVFGRRRNIEDKIIHNSDFKSDVDGRESIFGCVFLCNEI